MYATEEVYFPTLASIKVKRIGYPYCYLNWKKKLVLTVKEIELIKLNKISQYVKNGNERKFFSVKRVPRIMDDAIRQYIQSLLN